MNKTEFLEILKNCHKLGRFFVAYNVNLDRIVDVNKNLEKLTEREKINPEFRLSVNSLEELFSVLAYCIKYGESLEVAISEEFSDHLKEIIRNGIERLGGQAGIIANHLAKLGINPILHIPFISNEILKFLDKKIVFLQNNEIKSRPEVIKSDRIKRNWVFEFRKGERFLRWKSKSSGRLILSTRIEDFRMEKINVDFDFNYAIISGFQTVLKEYRDGSNYRKWFKIGKENIRRIRKKGRKVHYEFVFTDDEKILKEILNLMKICNSIGLDEQELVEILNFIGKEDVAERIHKTHNITNIYEGLINLKEFLRIDRIHLHGRNYFLSLVKDLGGIAVKKAMLFSGIISASYLMGEIKNRNNFLRGLKIGLSRKGFEEKKKLFQYLNAGIKEYREGILKCGDYNLIFTPNRIVRNFVKVVGIGDIISSSTFTGEEVAISLYRKKIQE